MTEKDELRAEARSLGIVPEDRWSIATLKAKIAEAKGDEGEEGDEGIDADTDEGEDRTGDSEPAPQPVAPALATDPTTGSPVPASSDLQPSETRTDPVGPVGDATTDATVRGQGPATDVVLAPSTDALDARERDIARRERAMAAREEAHRQSVETFGTERAQFEEQRAAQATTMRSLNESEEETASPQPGAIPEPEQAENVAVRLLHESFINENIWPAGYVIENYTGAIGSNLQKGRIDTVDGVRVFVADDSV